MKRIVKKLQTKQNIIAEIAEKKNLPLATAHLFVNTVFDEISKSLLKDQKVEIRGFGTFGVKKYKSYKGRNPRTQKQVMVRAKKRPWFKPGLFREILNK